jgi:hypothetical protein
MEYLTGQGSDTYKRPEHALRKRGGERYSHYYDYRIICRITHGGGERSLI